MKGGFSVLIDGDTRYPRDAEGNLLAGRDIFISENTIYVSSSNDQIDSFTGNDLLGGGAGNDSTQGDEGGDCISSAAKTFADRQQYGICLAAGLLGVPAGKTLADQGTLWGIHLGSYFLVVWSGMSETPTPARSDVLDAGTGNDDTLYGGVGSDNFGGDTSAENADTPAFNPLIWGNGYLIGVDGVWKVKSPNARKTVSKINALQIVAVCAHSTEDKGRVVTKTQAASSASKRLAA